MAALLRWLSRPLVLMAVGVLVGIADWYRTSQDLLPDVVGWLLVVVAASLVVPQGSAVARHVGAVRWFGGLAALLGLWQLGSGGDVKPLHYAIVDDAHHEGVLRVLVDLVVLLAEVGVVVAVCVLAGGLAAAGGDERWVRRWSRLRLGYLAVAALVVVLTPVFMLVDGDRVGDFGRSLLVGLIVPAVFAFLWIGLAVAVALAFAAGEPWARRDEAATT